MEERQLPLLPFSVFRSESALPLALGENNAGSHRWIYDQSTSETQESKPEVVTHNLKSGFSCASASERLIAV